MNRLILISAVCMQFGWISGIPNPSGVGAYAYQDSNGNRYGGTYGLKDDQINVGNLANRGNFGQFNPVPFQPDFDDFFPEYFRNFENLLQDRRVARSPFLPPLPPLPPLVPFRPFRPLQPLPPLRPLVPQPSESFPLFSLDLEALLELALNQPPLPERPAPFNFPPLFNWNTRAFNSNTEYQKKALETAKKAYDLTSNQAGFMNFDFSRFAPFGGMPRFDNFAAFGNNDNSAFASGVAAPGYTHQMAAISPDNPNMPNVDVSQRFSEVPGAGNYMSVSSFSSSSSTNNNGEAANHRLAETIVNNNGKVTHYKVEN